MAGDFFSSLGQQVSGGGFLNTLRTLEDMERAPARQRAGEINLELAEGRLRRQKFAEEHLQDLELRSRTAQTLSAEQAQASAQRSEDERLQRFQRASELFETNKSRPDVSAYMKKNPHLIPTIEKDLSQINAATAAYDEIGNKVALMESVLAEVGADPGLIRAKAAIARGLVDDNEPESALDFLDNFFEKETSSRNLLETRVQPVSSGQLGTQFSQGIETAASLGDLVATKKLANEALMSGAPLNENARKIVATVVGPGRFLEDAKDLLSEGDFEGALGVPGAPGPLATASLLAVTESDREKVRSLRVKAGVLNEEREGYKKSLERFEGAIRDHAAEVKDLETADNKELAFNFLQSDLGKSLAEDMQTLGLNKPAVDYFEELFAAYKNEQVKAEQINSRSTRFLLDRGVKTQSSKILDTGSHSVTNEAFNKTLSRIPGSADGVWETHTDHSSDVPAKYMVNTKGDLGYRIKDAPSPEINLFSANPEKVVEVVSFTDGKVSSRREIPVRQLNQPTLESLAFSKDPAGVNRDFLADVKLTFDRVKNSLDEAEQLAVTGKLRSAALDLKRLQDQPLDLMSSGKSLTVDEEATLKVAYRLYDTLTETSLLLHNYVH